MTRVHEHSDLYREVMQSPEWRAVKYERLVQVGFRCERCGRSKRESGSWLEAHHRFGYSMLGSETVNDISMLCHSCHMDAHGWGEPERISWVRLICSLVCIVVGLAMLALFALVVLH